MPRVVKTDGGILRVEPEHVMLLAPCGVEFAEEDARTEEALVEKCRDAVALLVLAEPITDAVLRELRHCRVVTRLGVGLDSIDVPAATARGIRVTNVPDSSTEEVALHALAMILSLIRRLPQFDASIRDGRWSYLEVGTGMRRAGTLTLGLVGFGRIGRRVAAGAATVGFRIVASDPAVPDDAIRSYGAEPLQLGELLTQSDVVSLHLPLQPSTRNLIDAAALARMKPGSILVNVSRGGIVDEDALVDALVGGHLASAGLDVFAQEPLPDVSRLRQAPNTLLTPHAAHWSPEAYDETIRKAFTDVARVLQGLEPRYPVSS
jgi:phosphoglycerate dehydrogenase-like enzyme